MASTISKEIPKINSFTLLDIEVIKKMIMEMQKLREE